MQSNSKDQRAKIQVWALWCFCFYVLSDSDCFFVFSDSGRRWPQKKHSIKGQVNLGYIFMRQDHTRRKACLRSISLDFAIYRVYASNVSGKQVNTKRLVRTNTQTQRITHHQRTTIHQIKSYICHTLPRDTCPLHSRGRASVRWACVQLFVEANIPLCPACAVYISSVHTRNLR